MLPRLWVQSDNTVKELRNQYGMRCLASLAQCKVFSSTTEAHLRVGHTHEDIDAIFSLVTASLRSASPMSLQTPHDLVRRINEKIGPVFASKQMSWGIELVQSVFGQLLAHLF